MRPFIRATSWTEDDAGVVVHVAIRGAWQLAFKTSKEERARWIDRRIRKTRAWLIHNGIDEYTMGDDHIVFPTREDAMMFFLAFR